MFYTDRIWGKVLITDPLVLKIINSPEMQRLKEINQAGYPKPFFHSDHFQRFEHCLGVYLLLTKFQAPRTECIAGLIHDVSHGVFSHALDYVLKEGSEKKQHHQDNIHPFFVKNSSLADMFKKEEIDIDYILDDKNFPFKETELPDLCADRIDYSLREGLVYNLITIIDAKNILANLVVIKNKWVFSDYENARDYAQTFLKLNGKYWASLESVSMFRTTGDYLKYSLEKQYISKDDLYTTDKEVLAKIKPFIVNDPQLALLWQRMNGKSKITNDKENFDAKVYCKSRVVDPLCLDKGKIKRVSDVDKNWKEIIRTNSGPKVYYLKFES